MQEQQSIIFSKPVNFGLPGLESMRKPPIEINGFIRPKSQEAQLPITDSRTVGIAGTTAAAAAAAAMVDNNQIAAVAAAGLEPTKVQGKTFWRKILPPRRRRQIGLGIFVVAILIVIGLYTHHCNQEDIRAQEEERRQEEEKQKLRERREELKRLEKERQDLEAANNDCHPRDIPDVVIVPPPPPQPLNSPPEESSLNFPPPPPVPNNKQDMGGDPQRLPYKRKDFMSDINGFAIF